MARTQVQRLSRAQIDLVRWDEAVNKDPIPLPYGQHWWLDAATDFSWEGLVIDDYRVVMALPRLRRFRILPVYIRPPYTQQLGPYGDLRTGDTAALLNAVPSLPQIALPLRPTLPISEIPGAYARRKRINYVVDLSPTFAEVVSGFSKRMRSYVRKHSGDELTPADRLEVVKLCKERLGGRGGVRDYHFERLDSLIEACLERDAGNLYQLRDGDELLCMGFYPHFSGRTFNAAAASTEAGLNQRGMTRMLAKVFEARSGVPGSTFDFEGSELPGVKEYFASFGGDDEGYILLEKSWWAKR